MLNNRAFLREMVVPLGDIEVIIQKTLFLYIHLSSSWHLIVSTISSSKH
jgi:hypothetical protein